MKIIFIDRKILANSPQETLFVKIRVFEANLTAVKIDSSFPRQRFPNCGLYEKICQVKVTKGKCLVHQSP